MQLILTHCSNLIIRAEALEIAAEDTKHSIIEIRDSIANKITNSATSLIISINPSLKHIPSGVQEMIKRLL